MTENTENSIETTRVVGRPFPKGVSGNPGGRPRGLAAYVWDKTDGGAEIVGLMVSVLKDGAEGESRTRTSVTSTVFETAASTVPPLRHAKECNYKDG